MIVDFYSFVSVPASACLGVVSVTYSSNNHCTLFSSTRYYTASIAEGDLKMAASDLTMRPAVWTPASHLLPCQHRAPDALGIGCVKSPSYGAELCKSLRFCKICAWLKKNMMWKFEASHSTLSGQMYSLPLQSIGMPMSAFINAGTQLPLEVSS